MAGITKLKQLISEMEPVLNDGKYVFASVSDVKAIPRDKTLCEIKEREGVTVVMTQADADDFNITYQYVAAWITLNIHSALQAVGLTAAFSTALTDASISCNVIAGFYHDHIFIDYKDKDKAMNTLIELTRKYRS